MNIFRPLTVKEAVKPATILSTTAAGALLTLCEAVAPPEMTKLPLPATITLCTNRAATPPQQRLPKDRDHRSGSPRSLKRPAPGVYQSMPWAILLKVPGVTGDKCVVGSPTPLPPARIRHPQIQVMPVER